AAYVLGMRRVAAAAAILALGATTTLADPTPIPSGAQVAPPVQAGEPVLDQDTDGRRNVRGCAVDEACGRAKDVLREFELERLPPAGGDPWISSERAPAVSRLEPAVVRLAKKPSELRPDAPWLDSLELPDLPIKWSQR